MEILIYTIFWLAAVAVFAVSLRAELAAEGRLPRRTSASKTSVPQHSAGQDHLRARP